MSREKVFVRHVTEEGFDFYDDCPICQTLRVAENEGRFMGLDEYMQACNINGRA